MPTTLEELYAHPKFIEKVERPIIAEIMSWKFPAGNPAGQTPTAVTLHGIDFSGEDEERIQGEVIVTSHVAVDATITTSDQFTQSLEGFMNFSLPWGWQDRDARFVSESAQVALTDLRIP